LFVHYEGGLEWSGDIRDPYMNEFMVRFIAVDPYWYEDTQDVHVPTGYQLLTSAGRILARIDGEWQKVGTCDNNVYKIAYHPNGDIYVGGAFTGMSGVANTAYIAKYDGSSWSALAGATNLNGEVRAIEFLTDGRVLLGGGFTTYGATTCNYICIYDPVGDSYSLVGGGPGFDNKVYDFARRKDGKIITSGLFVKDGNNTKTFNSIALYDPPINRFDFMGTGPGLSGACIALSMDQSGENCYCGGTFDDHGGGAGSTFDHVARYDVEDDTFNAMGTGLDADVWVYDMLCAHDNRVYAVGEFTHIGYVDVNYVGVWNGREWYPLGAEGDGVDQPGGTPRLRSLHEDYKGLIYMGGDFNEATGTPLARAICTWNKSRFQHMDLVVPDQDRVYTINSNHDDLWIGFNASGTGKAAEVFTITNIGKATTFPILEIEGPCYIQWFENQTTGDVVRLDLDIWDAERVVIDFRPWNKTVRSNMRPDIRDAILPDSNDIYLLPGENKLALFCEDVDPYTNGTEISLRWPIVHWSFDDLR
jgi:hypothetical protein